MILLRVIGIEVHHWCFGLSAFNWSMWWEQVGLFTVPVAFHDICGGLCGSAGNSIKCVFVWRGCLSLTDGWGWPLRCCVSGAALWWFMYCFQSLNHKRWETVFTVSAWQQPLCLRPVVDRVAGYSNIFPTASLAGVVIYAENQSTFAISCCVILHYFDGQDSD